MAVPLKREVAISVFEDLMLVVLGAPLMDELGWSGGHRFAVRLRRKGGVPRLVITPSTAGRMLSVKNMGSAGRFSWAPSYLGYSEFKPLDRQLCRLSVVNGGLVVWLPHSFGGGRLSGRKRGAVPPGVPRIALTAWPTIPAGEGFEDDPRAIAANLTGRRLGHTAGPLHVDGRVL